MKFCTNCRNEINLDAKFCENCGIRQDLQDIGSPTTTDPLDMPVDPFEAVSSTRMPRETNSDTNQETNDDADDNYAEEVASEIYNYINDDDDDYSTIPDTNVNIIEAETITSSVQPVSKGFTKKQIITQFIVLAIIGALVAIIVNFVLDFNHDFVEEPSKTGDVFVNLDVDDMPTLNLDETENENDSPYFEMDGSTLVEYKADHTIVTLPDTITAIGANAFANSPDLIKITLPVSITSIDPDAFNGCTILDEFLFIGEPSEEFYTMLGKLTIFKDFIIQGQTITGYRGLSDTVTIPNFITKIDDGYYDFDTQVGVFSQRYNIRNITIPESVTYIGENAFAGCSSLEQLSLPTTIEHIGDNAFASCSSLVEVTLPDSIAFLGEGVFSDCSSLSYAELSDSIIDLPKNTFKNCVALSDIDLKSISTIGENALFNCQALETIDVPPTVILVEVGAFSNTTWYNNLKDEFNVVGDGVLIKYSGAGTNVTIPNTVRHIGNVFFTNENLQTVIIPDSVVSINSKAFANRRNLTQVTFSNALAVIGENAFENCSSLVSVVIPDSVNSIKDNAFLNCTLLAEVEIPDTLGHIGNSAFEGTAWYDSLSDEYNIFGEMNLVKYNFKATSTVIPVGVTSINERLFFGSTNLKSVTIPDSVTSIGDESFFKCSSITKIEIPSTLKSIGYNAFNGCNSLTEITLPPSLEFIGEYAFNDCSSLEVVYVEEGSYAHTWCDENLDSDITIEFY